MKVAFIVVALAAAVLITVMYGVQDEAIPDTGENNSEWLCVACDHQFQLTPKEESEAGQKGPFPFPPTLCKKCNEHQAWRAVRCNDCGYFFSMGAPQSSGKCPRCHPEAPSMEEEWQDEEGEYGEMEKPPPVI
jgi:hypothetical protein